MKTKLTLTELLQEKIHNDFFSSFPFTEGSFIVDPKELDKFIDDQVELIAEFLHKKLKEEANVSL